jgi:hypothetical protein
MLSGRRLDLLDPTPVDIEIEDIAHGLAFVARWNGQTRGDWPYSVAEHSLLVEEIFARANPGIAAKWRLAAVLHDAPEYVIGDMISPVKAAVGPGYGELDERLTAAVHLRFGLPASAARADQEGDQGGGQGFGLAGGGADRGVFGKRRRTSCSDDPCRELLHRLEIRLRPPAEVRADYVARHSRVAGGLHLAAHPGQREPAALRLFLGLGRGAAGRSGRVGRCSIRVTISSASAKMFNIFLLLSILRCEDCF